MNAGDHKMTEDLPAPRVDHDKERDHQQVREHEQEHRALPQPEAAAGAHGHQTGGGNRYGYVLGYAKVRQRQAHPDELRDDDQEVL